MLRSSDCVAIGISPIGISGWPSWAWAGLGSLSLGVLGESVLVQMGCTKGLLQCFRVRRRLIG